MSNLKSEVQVNMQVGSSSPKFNTDGRTDELTKMALADVDQLTAVDARCDDGFATIGEVLAAGIWQSTERHPIVRSGERTPIAPHVRAAVMYRDRFKCQLCPTGTDSPEVIELDHIIPWSAGGSDKSTNLRVLCQQHNQERSNFRHPDERPALAATWWCVGCHSPSDDPDRLWRFNTPIPRCPKHGEWQEGLRNRCRVQRAYARALEHGEPSPTWHRRTEIEAAPLVAYCAHCNQRAMTDVTL